MILIFPYSKKETFLIRSYNPYFKRVGSFHCTLHQSREQEIQLIIHQFCFCTTADMEHCWARKNVQNPSPKNLEESLNSPGGNPCKIRNLFSPATRDLFEIRILLWRVSINRHYHFVWTPFSRKNWLKSSIECYWSKTITNTIDCNEYFVMWRFTEFFRWGQGEVLDSL